jgi:hypothetical protein
MSAVICSATVLPTGWASERPSYPSGAALLEGGSEETLAVRRQLQYGPRLSRDIFRVDSFIDPGELGQGLNFLAAKLSGRNINRAERSDGLLIERE